MKKFGTASKRTLNMAAKPRADLRPAAAAALIIIVGGALLARFGVIARLERLEREEAELSEMTERLSALREECADFNEIKSLYERRGFGPYDRTLCDRLEILEFLEETVFPSGRVESLGINGRTVSLKVSGPTLSETSELLDALKSDIRVETVTISSFSEEQKSPSVSLTVTLADASGLSREAEKTGGE